MAENKKTPITIDDKEYHFEDMTQEQQTILNHIADLEKKINGSKFNLDQLQVGREAFIKMLRESLDKEEAEKEVKEGDK